MARDEQVLLPLFIRTRETNGQLELSVKPDPGHDHRAATAFVSGVVDVLKIERTKHSVVERDWEVVVALHDFFGTVGQRAVSEIEACGTNRQLSAMIT
jgi:hypothetical protein